jgi:predicted alpha/beta superfamily hydrolase
MGMTNSSVFGKVGVFSPAFWAGPNFRANTLNTAPKLPLTIYMDIGSSEASSSQDNPDIYWLDAFSVYNKWQDVGYSINSDFLMYPQCETGGNRVDSLDPDGFKYTITAKEITA